MTRKPKYLVCDAPPAAEEVISYVLRGIGTEAIEIPRLTGDEADRYGMKFDITDIPPGAYSLSLWACNEWVCGEEAARLDFTRPENPSIPVLRLV